MILGGITLGGELGGYTLINEPFKGSLPQDLATGFYVAEEGFVGSSFKPLFVVGKQTANGVNYFLIAEQTTITAKPEKHIVGLIVNIPPAGVNGGDGFGQGARFVKVIDANEPDVPDDILEIINESLKNKIGATHKPVALIGTQIVKGTNYYVVAESKGVYPKAKPFATLITVNKFGSKNTVKIEDLLHIEED